jgi:hypothetical protein
VWQLRSARVWELDLSMLNASGITPAPHRVPATGQLQRIHVRPAYTKDVRKDLKARAVQRYRRPQQRAVARQNESLVHPLVPQEMGLSR